MRSKNKLTMGALFSGSGGFELAGKEIRPRFMMWENVPGAFSSKKGEDFRSVIEEIERIKESMQSMISAYRTVSCTGERYSKSMQKHLEKRKMKRPTIKSESGYKILKAIVQNIKCGEMALRCHVQSLLWMELSGK